MKTTPEQDKMEGHTRPYYVDPMDMVKEMNLTEAQKKSIKIGVIGELLWGHNCYCYFGKNTYVLLNKHNEKERHLQRTGIDGAWPTYPGSRKNYQGNVKANFYNDFGDPKKDHFIIDQDHLFEKSIERFVHISLYNGMVCDHDREDLRDIVKQYPNKRFDLRPRGYFEKPAYAIHINDPVFQENGIFRFYPLKLKRQNIIQFITNYEYKD